MSKQPWNTCQRPTEERGIVLRAPPHVTTATTKHTVTYVCGGELVLKGTIPDADGFPHELRQCEKCKDVTLSN